MLHLSLPHLIVVTLLVFVSLVPLIALAGNTPPQFEDPLNSGPDPALAIQNMIKRVIRFILVLSGVLALLAIANGGVGMIIGSFAGERSLVNAKRSLLFGILGLLFVGIASALLLFIQQVIEGTL